MATIHHTTLAPTKLELLTAWLPRQSWYVGPGAPELGRAGGFRLDDPAGDVGIEFMVVTDAASPAVAGYLTPLTYRSVALPGATLIGTSEHGVLGHRFVYDGATDPVLRAQLTALVAGKAEPQAQSKSHTADPSVLVGVEPGVRDVELLRVLVTSDAEPVPGEVSVSWRLADGTEVRGMVARASAPR